MGERVPSILLVMVREMRKCAAEVKLRARGGRVKSSEGRRAKSAIVD
jgi:hypothetical protein